LSGEFSCADIVPAALLGDLQLGDDGPRKPGEQGGDGATRDLQERSLQATM
jgi:hypothetical protein